MLINNPHSVSNLHCFFQSVSQKSFITIQSVDLFSSATPEFKRWGLKPTLSGEKILNNSKLQSIEFRFTSLWNWLIFSLWSIIDANKKKRPDDSSLFCLSFIISWKCFLEHVEIITLGILSLSAEYKTFDFS